MHFKLHSRHTKFSCSNVYYTKNNICVCHYYNIFINTQVFRFLLLEDLIYIYYMYRRNIDLIFALIIYMYKKHRFVTGYWWIRFFSLTIIQSQTCLLLLPFTFWHNAVTAFFILIFIDNFLKGHIEKNIRDDAFIA